MVSVMKLYELAGVNRNTHYLTPDLKQAQDSSLDSDSISLIFGYFISFYGLQEQYGRLTQYEGQHWVAYEDIYTFYSFFAINDSFTDSVKVMEAVKEMGKQNYMQLKEIKGKLYYTLCEKAMNVCLYKVKV